MKRCAGFLAAAMLVTVLAGSSFGYDWGTNPGNGTAENPYQISTAEQLASIGSDAALLDKCFVLMNDIDMEPALTGIPAFTTAVIAPNGSNPFTGRFNGNGHVISHLTIDDYGNGNDYLGLFGKIGHLGIVDHLGLDGISVRGRDRLGGISGESNGFFLNCYAKGFISGRNSLGGLCGSIYFTGSMQQSGIIQCYGCVNIEGEEYVGGLCGGANAMIVNCYSTGKVYGAVEAKCVGALCGCGYIFYGDNFYFLEGAGPDNGIGIALTESQMKDRNRYTGWYFSDPESGVTRDWYLPAGGYPVLSWESGKWLTKVPDITGMSEVEAIHLLSQNGLVVGKTIPVNSMTVPEGMTAGISACIGGYVTCGKRIDLMISAGSCGTGEEDSPYPLACEQDLQYLGDHLELYKKCFVLTSDIYITSRYHTTALIAPDLESPSSGDHEFNGDEFQGVFDGNNRRIIGLGFDPLFDYQMSNYNIDYLGLFGQIGEGGIVRHLVLEKSLVVSGTVTAYLGSLCGRNYGEISSCSANGDVTDIVGMGRYLASFYAYSGPMGGLCGENNGIVKSSHFSGGISHGGGICETNRGDVQNSSSAGFISNSSSSGGLCGFNYGNLQACYSMSNLGHERDYIMGYSGGFCGENEGSIANCYARGAVTAWKISYGGVGGFCGENYGTIENCYAAGGVSIQIDEGKAGGFCDWSLSWMLPGCYFLSTSGPDNANGTALTDEQMKMQGSFAGWDFASTWAICEGTNYPRLRWQIPTGDWICPEGIGDEDLNLLRFSWLSQMGTGNWDGRCDLNGDGKINTMDLLLFRQALAQQH